jgi:hypothetical protein
VNKYEKLILLLIALVLLGRFGGLARDIYIARTYGAIIPPDVEHYWTQISIVFTGLLNIGSAIWLYIEARSLSLKAWVWSLLGLFFGLIGLILFYAIQIFLEKRSNET